MHDGSRVRVTMVQLPAVNTPQFDWSLARLPRAPQPLPPIYEPEVAARAVAYAADHPRRREHEAGFSSVGTIVANKLAPGMLDRYLARNGYSAQQTDRPLEDDRPVNLWDAADHAGGTDFGAHGPFSDRARQHSPQRWLARHRVATAATGAAAAVGGYVVGRQVFRR